MHEHGFPGLPPSAYAADTASSVFLEQSILLFSQASSHIELLLLAALMPIPRPLLSWNLQSKW